MEESTIAALVQSGRQRLDRLEWLAGDEGLETDLPSLAAARQAFDLVEALMNSDEARGHAAELRVRAGMQLATAATLALDWRSPAAVQAIVLAVGDVAALQPGAVNYARCVQPGLTSLEKHLASQLEVVPGRTVLACGSGQAALSVLLAALIGSRRLRRPLIAPTVYCEVRETINLFSGGRAIVADETDPRAIIDCAVKSSADAVFVDPLGNGPKPRLCDIEAVAAAMADRLPDAVLVADLTMLPCAGLYRRLANSPHVLMYESSGKYRHGGLDLALGGLVCVPEQWGPRTHAARRQTGAVPDRYTVELWPRLPPGRLAARFEQMQTAAVAVARALSQRDLGEWCVSHPSLASHPDHHAATQLRWCGTCITLTPSPGGTQHTAAMCETAIDHARDVGTPLVVGESFGFSISRLSFTPAGVPEPPFVRLSVGTLDADDVERLSDCVSVACRHHR